MSMDDANHSQIERKTAAKLVGRTITVSDGNGGRTKISAGNTLSTNYIKNIKRGYNIRDRSEIDIFDGRFRFGVFDPYNAIGTAKEFLFITKPDLNIYSRDDTTGAVDTSSLNDGLGGVPYFVELAEKYPQVLQCLQSSAGELNDPFNHLLENMVTSNLSIPSLDAETIDTPSNMYGVNFSYRGSSEASNDSFEFDLEFKDTRYLHVYQFFKAYEEYETLKHHGTVAPWRKYTTQKIIHDQFSIYKFIVDEDFETILYYAKFYGVMPKSLPRDVFSNTSFENGLSYSVGFKAAFFDDMDPYILNDFNALMYNGYHAAKYRIDIFNEELDRMDNRTAKYAYITSSTTEHFSPSGKIYKLKWRGDDTY